MEETVKYAKRFNLNFKIATNSEEILKYFFEFSPKLFIVECYDETFEEFYFIRRLSPNIPIIAISNSNDKEIAIKAYKEGAINFLRLPYDSIEFYYHLMAILKMLNLHKLLKEERNFYFGEFKLNTKINKLSKDNVFIPLTNTEYKILLLLVENINCIVPNDKIYHYLWSSSFMKDTSRTLQMHISHLRKKLGLSKTTSINIVTFYRKGYALIEKNIDT